MRRVRRRSGEAAAGDLRIIAARGSSRQQAARSRIAASRCSLRPPHPAVEPGIRAPLMLQAVLGFDARMIASAFLASPDAMAKRLVRAQSINRGTVLASA
jgi:RNA polymerase sigma-70 factor (ECF subfamily)